MLRLSAPGEPLRAEPAVSSGCRRHNQVSLGVLGSRPQLPQVTERAQGAGALRISRFLIKKSKWFKYQNSPAGTPLGLCVSYCTAALPTARRGPCPVGPTAAGVRTRRWV